MALCQACREGDLSSTQLLIEERHDLEETIEYKNPQLGVRLVFFESILECTPLQIASSEGHLAIVKKLIIAGANIHAKDPDYGVTVLHFACCSGHLDVVVILLDSGCEVNEPSDDNDVTPLMCAAGYGHSMIVSVLLQRGADVHLKTEVEGFTALYLACQEGHLQCAQLLLNSGSRVNEPDGDKYTPLIYAARNGHHTIITELLQRGANVHLKTKEDGFTALHLACQYGHLQCAQLLLNSGSRVNEPNACERTPLVTAANVGHHAIITELLQRGADVHLKTEDGFTALHFACQEGHLQCAQLLLNSGSRVNEPDGDKYTPLIYAARNGHHAIIAELLQRGADVHLKTEEDGFTALHLACQYGHLQCAQLLLNSGSRVNEPNACERTPLVTAANVGHHAIITELLQRGANVHLKTEDEGYTALHYACQKGHLQCAQLLVDAGSSLNNKDFHGYTPLELASKSSSISEDNLAKLQKLESAKSAPWLDVYEDVLQKGSSVRQYVIHFITMGPPGVGKTWLKNLLTGRPNNTSIPSTPCLAPPEMCIPKKEIFVNTEDDTWTVLTAEEELKAVVHEFQDIFNFSKQGELEPVISTEPQIIRTSAVTKMTAKTSADTEKVKLQEGLSAPLAAPIHHPSPQKRGKSKPIVSFSALFEKKMQNLLKEVKSNPPVSLEGQSVIYFTDTGGQASFHEIHPALLTAPGGIYMLVFNLKNVDVKNKEKSRHQLDLVERALRSIHYFTVRPHDITTVERYMKISNESSVAPKVFIIGTHKDEVKEDLEKRVALADEVIQDMKCGKAYSCYCPDSIITVDNTQAGKSTSEMKENEELLTLLKSTKDSLNKISIDIPLKWWLFHLYIRHDFETSQPRDKKWVYRSSELEEKAKSIGICPDPVSDKSTSEFYAMVKLFHHLTFWVNFEPHSPHQPPQDTPSLSDYIVTHPASLYKYISKLVNIQERDNLKLSHHEKDFKSTGRFTKAILSMLSYDNDQSFQSQDIRQWFINLLIHLRIASEYHEEKDDTRHPDEPTEKIKETYYIIPAAFPYNQSVTVPECTTVDTLRVTLKDSGFIPSGIYCKVICDLVTQHNEHDQKCTYKDKCNYKFQAPTFSRCTLPHTGGYRAVSKFPDYPGTVYLTESADAILIDITVSTKSLKNKETSYLLQTVHEFCAKWQQVVNESLLKICHKKSLLWEMECPLCPEGSRGNTHMAKLVDHHGTIWCSKEEEGVAIDDDDSDIDPAQLIWFRVPTNAEMSVHERNASIWKIFKSRQTDSDSTQKRSTPTDSNVSGPSAKTFRMTNGKNPEEIKQFINDNFENQLKHCDIKRIRFKLETDGVIDTDQRQQLDQCGTQSEANSVFREILLNDPTTQTLLAAADVLETAPDTTNMNKDFAKAIRQFIQPEGTCNPKFRTLSERCPIEKTNEPTKIAHELQLQDLCWIPFGINSIQVDTTLGDTCNLEPNGNAIQFHHDIWLRVNPGSSVKSCTEVCVNYGCIITGPFVLPDGYKLVSPVLYLDLKMDLICKPIDLHIPHWSSDPTSVRYIKAPHVPNPEGKYIFQLLNSDVNSDTLKMHSHFCLIAKVVKMEIPETYYLSWWENQRNDDSTYRYRVVATFSLGLWIKILRCTWKGWNRDVDTQLEEVNFQSSIKAVLPECTASICKRRKLLTKAAVRYRVDDADLKYKVEESLYPHFIFISSQISDGGRMTDMKCEIIDEEDQPLAEYIFTTSVSSDDRKCLTSPDANESNPSPNGHKNSDNFEKYPSKKVVRSDRTTKYGSSAEDKWKEVLQNKHWVYLLNNLRVQKIADHLYQGVQGRHLLTNSLYQNICGASNDSDANRLYLCHLKGSGAEKDFRCFIQILHNTSNDYPIHEEIVNTLTRDLDIGDIVDQALKDSSL